MEMMESGFAPWEFTQKGSTKIIGVDMEIAKYIKDNPARWYYDNLFIEEVNIPTLSDKGSFKEAYAHIDKIAKKLEKS